MSSAAEADLFHKEAARIKEEFIEELEGHDLEEKPGVENEFAASRIVEEEYVEEAYDKSSWQRKTFHVLESHSAEVFLIVLLFIDIAIVVVELFLEAQFPACHVVENMPDGYLFSCCKAAAGADHDEAGANHDRLLSSGTAEEEHHEFCDAGYEQSSADVGCDEHALSKLHHIHTALFIVSVSILGLFEIENLLKLYILKGAFLKNHYYVFDLIIVTLSLTLDVFLKVKTSIVAELAAMLVIVRLWRFVRIVHGIYINTLKTQYEKTLATNKAVDKYIKKIEHLIHEHVK